jgi:hypothetical protein
VPVSACTAPHQCSRWRMAHGDAVRHRLWRVVHEAKLPADKPIAAALPQDIEGVRPGPGTMHKLDPASAPDKSSGRGVQQGRQWPGFIAHIEGCLSPQLLAQRATSGDKRSGARDALRAGLPTGADQPRLFRRARATGHRVPQRIAVYENPPGICST